MPLHARGAKIDVMAHSFGGFCMVHTLSGSDEIAESVHRIAFTDSYHSYRQVQSLSNMASSVFTRSINYVCSEDVPFGQDVQSWKSLGAWKSAVCLGCACVSASCKDHAMTNYAALEDIFVFFREDPPRKLTIPAKPSWDLSTDSAEKAPTSLPPKKANPSWQTKRRYVGNPTRQRHAKNREQNRFNPQPRSNVPDASPRSPVRSPDDASPRRVKVFSDEKSPLDERPVGSPRSPDGASPRRVKVPSDEKSPVDKCPVGSPRRVKVPPDEKSRVDERPKRGKNVTFPDEYPKGGKAPDQYPKQKEKGGAS